MLLLPTCPALWEGPLGSLPPALRALGMRCGEAVLPAELLRDKPAMPPPAPGPKDGDECALGRSAR